MGVYSETIGGVKSDMQNKKRLETKKEHLHDSLVSSQEELVTMINAQRLLTSVSDDNTLATLNFITGLVNKALSELFKSDARNISLEKKNYAGSKPHIVVKLRNGDGTEIDLNLQSGTGLRQVVSFMYSICLIEIRKGRRLVISDEKLSGLHYEAKRIIGNIIKLFADGGFQFIFVEYSLDDIGKLYNVELRGTEATMHSLDGAHYDNRDIFTSVKDVDTSILDPTYVDDDLE